LPAVVIPRRESQPQGVLVLAAVEMWERFSFYGMVAILVLFLIRPEDGPFPPGPGQGFTEADAAALFGSYSALILAAPLVGGWVGDRLIGPRRALVIGGVLISCGHLLMVVSSFALFWIGLLVVAAGTGLLKPNISAVLGGLYADGDPRRDGGFALFYFGINAGAFTAPIICGWLATTYSWRAAFSVAGVGMVVGLLVYAAGRHRLGRVGLTAPTPATSAERRRACAILVLGGVLLAIAVAIAIRVAGFTAGAISAVVSLAIVAIALVAFRALLRRTGGNEGERRHILAFLLLFISSVIYFALASQAGSTITEFTQDWVDRDIGSFTVPTSWLLSLNPVLVVILAPVSAALWIRLGDRAPSTPTKVSLALIGVGLSFLIIAIPGFRSQSGLMSNAMWVLASFLVLTSAELLIVPIALSATTELAPAGLTGQMLGLWYLAAALGGAVGGQFARFVGDLGYGGYFLCAGLIVVVLGMAFVRLRPRWSLLLEPLR
jgi:POT family proton-dependent oligopeptide transporter